MSSLTNKQIVLGVTGGIAAYKSAEIIRRLQDRGATVRVVMTRAAQEFITPLTMQALSGNPVHVDLLDTEAEMGMGHIELARWADLIIVAPASANFIARLASGRSDDLLGAICLATQAPIAIAPAMNQGMWHNQSTQENLTTLQERGVVQFGPAAGSQACGDVGLGRMLEPGEIVELAAKQFQSGLLAGKRVVITAGPTREPLDPVRYLSNHSSGKMGYAVAEAAMEAGARVLLITGPTNLRPPERVEVKQVTTAEEMYQASLAALDDCDVFIASAAVADYRPRQAAEQKLKKGTQETMTIELVKNPDIVSAVAAASPKPFTVGFSAETEKLLEHARDKLQRKGLDLIVANDVSDTSIGFNSEDNAATLIWAEGESALTKRSKRQLARDLTGHIAGMLAGR
ncbi:bifunctional phosphopantothenoylcysteine decarboxylase/phosphopantothenate--cysteine ligase CoaBC [Proteobacteria bacterium 005FR1]|nr:bifunctional phosphopantothenoylcysteine decarboxylase/phosphopantothenate--cysteine ligase CoaBC [Proteobacteria bacterium 005FR1]